MTGVPPLWLTNDDGTRYSPPDPFDPDPAPDAPSVPTLPPWVAAWLAELRATRNITATVPRAMTDINATIRLVFERGAVPAEVNLYFPAEGGGDVLAAIADLKATLGAAQTIEMTQLTEELAHMSLDLAALHAAADSSASGDVAANALLTNLGQQLIDLGAQVAAGQADAADITAVGEQLVAAAGPLATTVASMTAGTTPPPEPTV